MPHFAGEENQVQKHVPAKVTQLVGGGQIRPRSGETGGLGMQVDMDPDLAQVSTQESLQLLTLV